MKKQWLLFLIFGALALIIFILFYYRIQPIEPPPKTTTANSVQIDEPTVSFVNPSKGAIEPKITLVEFGDFECGPCKQLSESIDIALKTFPTELKVVWKNLPNESAHKNATPAAVAAHCASNQGMFWEFHDALFQRQTFLSDAQYTQIAQELGLNEKKFNGCFNEKETLPIIKKDFDEAKGLNVLATPTIFIGTDSHVGYQTADELIKIISEKLNVQ
jgi:protein-disulfide isomerase